MASTDIVVGCKCCGPSCPDCGYLDYNTCSQGKIGQSIWLGVGDTCNGKTVKQDKQCITCVDCIYPNASWTPDPSTVLEGVEFEQTNSAGYAPKCADCVAGPNPDLSYPCAEKTRIAIGTKVPPTCSDCNYLDYDTCGQGKRGQSVWMDVGDTCNGKTFEQATQCITCIDCIYPSTNWKPDPSTKPLGVEFEQTNSAGYAPKCAECVAGPGTNGTYPCATATRIAIGTNVPPTCPECGYLDYDTCAQGKKGQSVWLDVGDVCNGKRVEQQTQCITCVDCIYPSASWTPATSTKPLGVEFEQTNSAGYAPKCADCVAGPNPNGSYPCATATRIAIGTNVPPSCPDCGYLSYDTCGQGKRGQSVWLDVGDVCQGKRVEQQTQCITCVTCVYPSTNWTPDPSTKPFGVQFEQTNSAGYAPKCAECVAGPGLNGSYPCATATRIAVGTYVAPTCSDCGLLSYDNCGQGARGQSVWMDVGDTCNGKTFKQQEQCIRCVSCTYPNASWTPDPSTVPETQWFEQTNSAGYAPKCADCVAGPNPDGSYPCAATTRWMQGTKIVCDHGGATVSSSSNARTSLGITVTNESPYLTITSSGSVDLTCATYWNGGTPVNKGGTCTVRCTRPNAPHSAPSQLEIFVGGTLLTSNSNYNGYTSLRGAVTARINDSGYYDNCGSYYVSGSACP